MPWAIRIDDERRQDLIGRLRAFFQEEFDEEISDFRASQLQRKLEDLEGEVYEGPDQ